jgi:hypothetical protein
MVWFGNVYSFKKVEFPTAFKYVNNPQKSLVAAPSNQVAHD